MLDILVNFLIPTFLKILYIFAFSISLRFILQITGQSWVKTTSHTATLTILPVVTFVITSVISGNIALSLGMVGALSIVRFRNPVRSPLELTVYFTAITIGIAASVSLKWLFFLAFSVYLVIFLLILLSFLSKKIIRKEFFISSFSEGNSLSTLEVTSLVNLKILDESKLLKTKSFSNEGKKEYLLASSSFDSLRKLIFEIENNKSIIKYQLNEC